PCPRPAVGARGGRHAWPLRRRAIAGRSDLASVAHGGHAERLDRRRDPRRGGPDRGGRVAPATIARTASPSAAPEAQRRPVGGLSGGMWGRVGRYTRPRSACRRPRAFAEPGPEIP